MSNLPFNLFKPPLIRFTVDFLASLIHHGTSHSLQSLDKDQHFPINIQNKKLVIVVVSLTTPAKIVSIAISSVTAVERLDTYRHFSKLMW